MASWLHFFSYMFLIPQYLQLTVWTLRSTREQIHSWILWVIVIQFQLSQVWGVWTQSWRQIISAFLCHHTARQPTDGSKQSQYLQTHTSSTKIHQYYGRLTLLLLLYVLNTSVSAADSLDSSVHQRADSLLNFVVHCYSVPALSGVRGLNSELNTNNHSLPLSPYNQTTYRWIKTVSLITNTQIIYKHTSTLWPSDCTFSLICS